MSLSSRDEILLVGSLAVYSLVGVSGNILILLVYHRKTEKLTLVSFIKLLAIVDLIVCAMIIPYTIAFELHHVTNDFVCRLFELVRHFTVLASNLTLLAVAVERYFAICRPLKRLSEEQIAKGVVVIALICVLMAVPSVFMFAVFVPEVSGDSASNQTEAAATGSEHRKYCQFTTKYLGESGTLLYQGFLVVLFFGGVIILTIFYSLVYTAVWKRTKVWMTNQVAPMTTTDEAPNTVITETASDSSSLPKKKDNCTETSVNKKSSNFLTIPAAVSHSPKTRRVDVACPIDENVELEKVQNNNNDRPPLKVKISNSASLTGSESQVPGKVHYSDLRRPSHHKTATMLFVCTLVFVVTWIPFWLDIFNVTKSVPLRFQFFISYASNPLIYGIVNKHIRTSISTMMCKCWSTVRGFCLTSAY